MIGVFFFYSIRRSFDSSIYSHNRMRGNWKWNECLFLVIDNAYNIDIGVWIYREMTRLVFLPALDKNGVLNRASAVAAAMRRRRRGRRCRMGG